MALSHPHPPVESLYIHTPFCVHKCHYCDFYSFVDSRDQQGAFVERLISELRVLAPHAADATGRRVPLRTIFVGGGTPSLLRTDLWERVLVELDALFDLSGIRAAGVGTRIHRGDGLSDTPEFTVECNPESATPELLRVLRAGGVNRVSMGAQSFIPAHLKTLERWHDVASVPRALDAARDAGIPRQSIDLIYAIPGQTLEQWRGDLETALALGTTHLSCYNLTYEPNTAMTKRLALRQFTPAHEDLEADMFTLTGELLASRGLRRYEVSNYALPGHESTHNLAYWRQSQWLAAGPSASGHVWAGADPLLGGHRFKNAPSLGTYLREDLTPAGYAPIVDHEPPDPVRGVRERVMTGVRLCAGLEIAVVTRDAERVRPGAGERLRAVAGAFVADGLVEEAAGRWRVTGAGWLLADFLARKLMAAVGED